MKIVFTKTVEGIGKRCNVQTVSDGYARNFLFPKKYAVPATTKAVETANKVVKNRQEKRADSKQSLLAQLPAIEGKSVTIKKEVNEQGRMYAAVEAKEISKAIRKTFGFYVPVTALNIPQIKDVGSHEASIKFENQTIQFTIELVNA